MKKTFTLVALAGALGITVSGAIAGPLLLGPTAVPVPIIMTVPVVRTGVVTPVQQKMLSTYRQLRTFWLSRAIVR